MKTNSRQKIFDIQANGQKIAYSVATQFNHKKNRILLLTDTDFYIYKQKFDIENLELNYIEKLNLKQFIINTIFKQPKSFQIFLRKGIKLKNKQQHLIFTVHDKTMAQQWNKRIVNKQSDSIIMQSIKSTMIPPFVSFVNKDGSKIESQMYKEKIYKQTKNIFEEQNECYQLKKTQSQQLIKKDQNSIKISIIQKNEDNMVINKSKIEKKFEEEQIFSIKKLNKQKTESQLLFNKEKPITFKQQKSIENFQNKQQLISIENLKLQTYSRLREMSQKQQQLNQKNNYYNQKIDNKKKYNYVLQGLFNSPVKPHSVSQRYQKNQRKEYWLNSNTLNSIKNNSIIPYKIPEYIDTEQIKKTQTNNQFNYSYLKSISLLQQQPSKMHNIINNFHKICVGYFLNLIEHQSQKSELKNQYYFQEKGIFLRLAMSKQQKIRKQMRTQLVGYEFLLRYKQLVPLECIIEKYGFIGHFRLNLRTTEISFQMKQNDALIQNTGISNLHKSLRFKNLDYSFYQICYNEDNQYDKKNIDFRKRVVDEFEGILPIDIRVQNPYHLLRPQYFLQFGPLPTLPTSFSSLQPASFNLYNSVLQQVKMMIENQQLYIFNSFQLVDMMHKKGINMRYLGYFVNSLQGYYSTVFRNDVVARVFKRVVKAKAHELILQNKRNKEQNYIYMIIDMINLIMSQNKQAFSLISLLSNMSLSLYNCSFQPFPSNPSLLIHIANQCNIQFDYDGFYHQKGSKFISRNLVRSKNAKIRGYKFSQRNEDFLLNVQNEFKKNNLFEELPIQIKFYPYQSFQYTTVKSNQPISISSYNHLLSTTNNTKEIPILIDKLQFWYGQFNPFIDQLYKKMVDIYKLVDKEKAINWMKKKVLNAIKVYPRGSQKVALAYQQCGDFMVIISKKEQAIQFYAKSLLIHQSVKRVQSQNYANLNLKISKILLSLGEIPESKEKLQTSKNLCQKFLPQTLEMYFQVLQILVRIYQIANINYFQTGIQAMEILRTYKSNKPELYQIGVKLGVSGLINDLAQKQKNNLINLVNDTSNIKNINRKQAFNNLKFINDRENIFVQIQKSKQQKFPQSLWMTLLNFIQQNFFLGILDSQS